MNENYAMIDGVQYPVNYEGVERATYKHLSGCLTQTMANGCCQCGALDRANKLYSVTVGPTSAAETARPSNVNGDESVVSIHDDFNA